MPRAQLAQLCILIQRFTFNLYCMHDRLQYTIVTVYVYPILSYPLSTKYAGSIRIPMIYKINNKNTILFFSISEI